MQNTDPESHSYNLRSRVDHQQQEMPDNVVMTTEQFQQLLQGMRDVFSVQAPSTQINQQTGNFAGCKSRFSGKKEENVEAFIDAITVYKGCVGVSDENAVKGIPMLLDGQAATWWMGAKSSLQTWDNAIESLRYAFGVNKPNHKIFKELFEKEQRKDEPTDIFVNNARALLAKLSQDPPLHDTHQLDMVYGLMHRRIRRLLPRDQVENFKELVEKARTIEESLLEGKEAQNDRKDDSTKKVRPKCNYCHNFGHIQRDCRKFATSLETQIQSKGSATVTRESNNTQGTRTSIECYGCGAPGVIRSRCTTCQKNTSSSGAPTASIRFFQANVEVDDRMKPLLPLTIGDADGVGFADSGAQVSIAGSTLYHHLKGIGTDFSKTKVRLSYADGIAKEEDVLETTVDVVIQGRTLTQKFLILPNLQNNSTLLGIDFLERAQIILNIPNKRWYFVDDPSMQYPFVDSSLLPVNGIVSHQVNNVCLRSDEAEELTTEQRRLLDEVLTNHSDIFDANTKPTSFAVHHIRTKDHDPIAVPPYPLSYTKKNFLQAELQQLLERGIIEECESPWASPVVLVPKKNSYRLCIDYRKLNAVTIGDSYPMPRLDELLHKSKRTPFMSTIDLQSGFWQVPITEEDRDKTCFVTPFGTYRFTRMPFGLKNAPATFSRLMDRFRNGLNDRTVFAYMDDILVLSESFDSHMTDLKAIFERLRIFDLSARREKCCFARSSVKYLGHLITSDGIQLDPEKMSAILEMVPPKSTKDTHSFVQTCSWYRKFIPRFSEIARPLTNLLRKGAPFRFAEEEMEAFNTLKKLLTSAPVLVQADPTKPYILRTDASSYALGAVILQGEGTNERPVEYASRLLLPAEKNYSTTEREALAVVWATEKFRTYLEGAEVTIASDHQPLQWLFTLKTPSGRLARWALRIQGLNMKIIYTPGRMNFIADMLSRPFNNDHAVDRAGTPVHTSTIDEESTSVCTVNAEMPRRSAVDIRQAQLSDPDVAKIVSAFETFQPVEMENWTSRGYVMLDGVLYRHDPELDADAQLVVPESERHDVMKQYHDAPTAGHYGADRTYHKIASRYYWPGLRRYITEYIKKCVECQKYKCTNLKPAGLLRTPVQGQRFETIAIDLFGPLPSTSTGHRWIFIVEDTASKWVELFPMVQATGENCARILLDEIMTRFGTPRKIISDNGVQFISDVMQQVAYCLGIKQSFIPVYHPQANPVERKNRDLKTQLAILVGNDHTEWLDKLPSIRFAMNTTRCKSTGYTAAYLTFGRELRTPDDVGRDLRTIVNEENFVPQITPYLLRLADTLKEARETQEKEQDDRKKYADAKRRNHPEYNVGDLVLAKTHVLSNLQKAITGKFTPRRDGPYRILHKKSPTTYEIASVDAPEVSLGCFHASDLTRFISDSTTTPAPIHPIRKRGRPRKKNPDSTGLQARALPQSRGGDCKRNV